MSRPEYFEHVARVERWLAVSSLRSAVALGATCAERHWPLYDRASAGRPWRGEDVVRRTLDAVWQWLVDGVPIENQLLSACDQARPEEPQTDAEGAAYFVSIAVWALASSIADGDPQQIIDVANSGLQQIDAFLDESLQMDVSAASDAAIEDHELTRAEIARQNETMAALSSEPSAETLAGLREANRGVCVLGNGRYPDEG